MIFIFLDAPVGYIWFDIYSYKITKKLINYKSVI